MRQASKEPIVSVIIPVYNVESYLSRCLDSVIGQSYKKIEIILVDDGSTDDSGKICDEYAKKDDRIRIIHQSNKGISDTRNIGIKESNGDYVSFVDSDDFVEKDYIEVLLKEARATKANLVIAGHYIDYPNRQYIKAAKESFVANSHVILDRMLYDEGIDISPWAKLYERKLFDQVYYPSGRIFEDTATTHKLIIKAEKISVVAKPIYHYRIRVGEKSITNCIFDERKLDLITATNEMTSDILEVYPDFAKGCQRRETFAYLATLSQLANSNSKDKKIANELISNIQKNRKTVLADKRTPKRDKFGILMTLLGYQFFRIVWKTYRKFRG